MTAEEKANTWTHLIAFVATLLIAWPLLHLAYQSQIINHNFEIVGTALFLLGMFLMYGSSTLYHAVSAPEHKRRLRVFDHISIYVMIAGSYSVATSVSDDGVGGVTGNSADVAKHAARGLLVYNNRGHLLYPRFLFLS